MSIASKLVKLETDVDNAYTAVNIMGGTVPIHKNTENLAPAIRSIPQQSISSDNFEYDNWISYGTTSPNPLSYKYWLPINTTPTSKPLKYVKNYKVADYFTGDLGNLVDENTGTTTKIQGNISIFGVRPDSYNHYFYSSSGQGAYPSNITIYKYTYTNQEMPSYEFTNSSYVENLGTLSTLLNTTASVYGCWTAYNNVIYGCFGNSIIAYDTSTNTRSTWASTSTTLLSSSYRGLGLIRRSSTEFTLFRTNSSGTTLEVLSISSSGTATTKASLTGLSSMTNFATYQMTTTQAYIMYKGTSWNMADTTQSKLYYYGGGSSITTTKTYPTSTGYMYARYCIPANRFVFRFTALSYKVYNLSDIGFTEPSSPSYGNLLKAAVQANTGAIGYYNGQTVRLCVPSNNFSIQDTGGTTYTYSFNSGNSSAYQIVQTTLSTNYSIASETIESADSNNNVLLISNYKNSIPTESYAFYPKSTSEIFLWLYKNSTVKFIYEQTEYTMQISVNGSWSTLDTENDIL